MMGMAQYRAQDFTFVIKDLNCIVVRWHGNNICRLIWSFITNLGTGKTQFSSNKELALQNIIFHTTRVIYKTTQRNRKLNMISMADSVVPVIFEILISSILLNNKWHRLTFRQNKGVSPLSIPKTEFIIYSPKQAFPRLKNTHQVVEVFQMSARYGIEGTTMSCSSSLYCFWESK